MHQVSIPETILARVRLHRGGREHLFDRLDMRKVAHVVIDLQEGFVAEGAPVEVPFTREMFGEVNAISAAVRDAGGLNVFTRYTMDEAEALPWTVWFRNYMSDSWRDTMQKAFSRGAPLWQLVPQLDVRAGDLVVDKTRFSALIPGTCTLNGELKARGINTVIITGTLTNCCCESTARDALQMGYNVIFVSDANAALTDEEHNATLMTMCAIFADVLDTAQVLALVARSSSARAAA